MTIFFEVLEKSIGLSRMGRIILSKESKKYVKTPNVVIPIKKFLLSMVDFLEEFEHHQIFMISKVIFLKIAFLRDKFKNNGFIYTHHGTLDRFIEILEENIKIFSEDNIIALIPFNNPIHTYYMDKVFAKAEIKFYVEQVNKILKKYPNLNFGISIRIFNQPELFNEYVELLNNYQNLKILNFNDILDSLLNYRAILNLVVQLKSDFDRNLLLMVSGKIPPKLYPIFVYLGFDLFNGYHQLEISSKDLYDTIEYSIPIQKMKYLPCTCNACGGNLRFLLNNVSSKEKVELLSLHNLISAKNYMRKIKQYITTEDWRFFVEKSSFDDTKAISMLKILDEEYSNFLCSETPIKQVNKTLNSLGPSSYFRPDFVRFRERVLSNFKPNKNTKIIILLPCSSKKPYSQSKSHKKFNSVISDNINRQKVQEFILTSPLGVIPRELENIYPVNSYDISVTGHWDKSEVNIATNMLLKFLEKYDSDIPVICHLPEGGYRKIINNVIKKVSHKFYLTEINGSSTSKASLRSFAELIKKICPSKESTVKNYKQLNLRKLMATLDYQFEKGIGEKIISKEVILRTDRRRGLIFIKSRQNEKNLGVYHQKSGQIILKAEGINKIKEFFKTNYFIVFDGSKLNGSTLFRPGILNYSEDLSPGNFVLMWDHKMEKIIGVGEMITSSHFLRHSKSGKIALIINKF